MAQHADWIFCLVRTETTDIKQQGISFLLIDMKTPGVEVKLNLYSWSFHIDQEKTYSLLFDISCFRSNQTENPICMLRHGCPSFSSIYNIMITIFYCFSLKRC